MSIFQNRVFHDSISIDINPLVNLLLNTNLSVEGGLTIHIHTSSSYSQLCHCMKDCLVCQFSIPTFLVKYPLASNQFKIRSQSDQRNCWIWCSGSCVYGNGDGLGLDPSPSNHLPTHANALKLAFFDSVLCHLHRNIKIQKSTQYSWMKLKIYRVQNDVLGSD